MSVKTSKNEKAPSANTTMIHVNDLHLGNNVARDTVAGKQGHSPEDISRLMMAIEEADMVIQNIVVGPKGYRDQNHPDTPTDKYPVLAGNGRTLAMRELFVKNPGKWGYLPALIQTGVGLETGEITNIMEAVRVNLTSLGYAQSYSKLLALGKSREQVASLFAVTPAEVTNYTKLNLLPPYLKELLVNCEKGLGDWEKGLAERNGIKLAKFTSSFAIDTMRKIAQMYIDLGKKDISSTDYAAPWQPIYSDWEKTGKWDHQGLLNFFNALRAKAGKEAVAAVGKPKTAETPNVPDPKKPASAPGSGQHRANQDGDPKPVTSTQSGANPSASAPTQTPAGQNAEPTAYVMRGPGLAFLSMLKGCGVPELVKVGQAGIDAEWETSVNGIYRMKAHSRAAWEAMLTETFGKGKEDTKTATTAS